ncbi:MAG: ribonuclease P protein component [Ignavibacteriae bacterium]|nr:ribonuclease P protein component [Ignavibacteriota bacterium]
MTRAFRLPKSEILRGRRAFSDIIAQHALVQTAELRCYYTLSSQIPPCVCTVGFAVKRASDSVRRNTAKRLLRETWRLNRQSLVDTCTHYNIGFRCVFLYIPGAEPLSFARATMNMIDILQEVRQRITERCDG